MLINIITYAVCIFFMCWLCTYAGIIYELCHKCRYEKINIWFGYTTLSFWLMVGTIDAFLLLCK